MMIGIHELHVCTAFFLDLFVGDPRNMPHPVRGIGFAASKAETFFRHSMAKNEKGAGILTVVLVVGGTIGISWAILQLSFFIHPWFGAAVSVLMLYYCFATGDLAAHARAVYGALHRGELDSARQKVGMMVGRDVDNLTESGVAQAAVESVAENSVDGITAPLFYALLFGPVGAMAYKAVNTLDSMFGYKSERYLSFGWASAKLDDVVNYLPARLTVPFIAVAAWLNRLDGGAVFSSVVRTARLHASPNAGYPEAAYGGALGVRLGGPRTYGGKRKDLPCIGIGDGECRCRTLQQALRVMYTSAFLFMVFGAGFVFLGKMIWQ